VETEAQFELLMRMGCQQMQGYLLARPVSACQVETLLTRRWGVRHANQAVRLNCARLHSIAG
jgi:predicted signal transduction protein with EAL and GGDEF domain